MLTQGTHYRRPLASNVVDADIALARGDKDSLRLLQSRVEFHAGMGALVFGDSRAESASFRIESEDRDKTMDPGQAEGFRLWMESELNDRDLDFPRGEVIVQMLVPDYQLENVPYGTFGVAMWERVRDLHGSAIGDPPAEWEDEHQAFMEGVKSPLR